MQLEILRAKAAMKTLHISAILTLLYLIPIPSQALPPWPEALRGNWEEIRTPEPTPPFCNHRLSMQRGPRWMGPGLSGVNHFCEAKVKHHICLKYQRKDRRACLLSLAKPMMDPVADAIENKKMYNHPMLPYFYTEYANFLSEAGEHQQAIKEYLTAIRKYRKYLPAYIKLANAFVRTKQYDKAEKTLKYALKITKNKRYKNYILKQLSRIKKKDTK